MIHFIVRHLEKRAFFCAFLIESRFQFQEYIKKQLQTQIQNIDWHDFTTLESKPDPEYLPIIKRLVGTKNPTPRRRLFILNNIESLSKITINAFLKLLEEGPDDVIFVLMSTNNYVIPQTFRSRCFELFLKFDPGLFQNKSPSSFNLNKINDIDNWYLLKNIKERLSVELILTALKNCPNKSPKKGVQKKLLEFLDDLDVRFLEAEIFHQEFQALLIYMHGAFHDLPLESTEISKLKKSLKIFMSNWRQNLL